LYKEEDTDIKKHLLENYKWAHNLKYRREGRLEQQQKQLCSYRCWVNRIAYGNLALLCTVARTHDKLYGNTGTLMYLTNIICNFMLACILCWCCQLQQISHMHSGTPVGKWQTIGQLK